MPDWLTGFLAELTAAIEAALQGTIGQIADAIWLSLMRWLYTAIYEAVADLFTGINYMGAEMFNLRWVSAVIELFTLFGWSLFVAGVAVAVYDVAVESQTMRVSVKTTALNILKGFFACSLVGIVPVELYKFCVSLQNTFAGDLTRIFAGTQTGSLGNFISQVLSTTLFASEAAMTGLKSLFILIGFTYCTVKVFFANIKRGGILLIQVAVGELYMFSIPRGYTDGFSQWCRQIAALCLTAFMQTTLLFLGLMTFQTDMLLGLGIMLAANEVPRIAQQFGLDSSVKVNMMSVVNTTSTAVHLARAASILK